MAGWMRGLLLVAMLLAGFALKGLLVTPPSLAPSEFDTGRAIARLQTVLGDQRPHPVDSAADDAVRARLIAELQLLGLQPRIQETMDCSAMPKSRAVSCSHVRNVIATVGRGGGKHVLLNAHYDSTPAGPGAADDGIGVAALLEVASILQKSPPTRPVTFLFNEGEEFGLNGSSAFVRDPLAEQVNALINIEARGVSGPALMFETSDPNGAAIAAYANAARVPYANSLSTDFARLIPNTTDVVEFRPSGWTMLNYAIIGNETRYHTPGDTIAALNRASLHHMGTEVLAATRAMTAIPDPARAGAGRTVFTDIAGRVLIRLPLLVAAIALGLLLISALFLAWRRTALGGPLLVAAGMTIGGVAAAGIASYAAGFIRAGDFWRAYPLVTYLALYAVLLGAMTLIWARWGRGIDKARMRAASWLLILLVGAAISLFLPGATIFFVFAPALALAGIAAARSAPKPSIALLVFAAVVQFVMLGELLALIEMLLIDGPLWAVAPLAALAALPLLIEIEPAEPRAALLSLVVAAVGLWTGAMLVPRSSAERPAAFTIDYFRDADRNSANWAVASKQAPLPKMLPGEWRKGTLPYNMRTRWVSAAPNLATPEPTARLIASEPAGSGRRVRLALFTGAANSIAIRFAESTKLIALGRPGQLERIPATGEPKKPLLRCSGRSCDGFVVEALLADRKPVNAELFSTVFALPPEGLRLAAARPRNAQPQYGSDQTITLKRFSL